MSAWHRPYRVKRLKLEERSMVGMMHVGCNKDAHTVLLYECQAQMWRGGGLFFLQTS